MSRATDRPLTRDGGYTNRRYRTARRQRPPHTASSGRVWQSTRRSCRPLASGTQIARRIHDRPLRAGAATTADFALRRDCSQQALQRDHDVAGTQSRFGRKAGGAERVLLGQHKSASARTFVPHTSMLCRGRAMALQSDLYFRRLGNSLDKVGTIIENVRQRGVSGAEYVTSTCSAGSSRVTPRQTQRSGMATPSRASDDARPHARIPAQQWRILAQERLVALGAGGEQAERDADELLQPLEIPAGFRRQIDLVLGARGRRHPALDLFVHRLELRQRRLFLREVGDGVAAPPVSGADLERL